MRKEEIRPNVVYKNKKTESIGVLYLGYDYGCLSSNEVGIVYKVKDNEPTTSFFVGTDPENLEEHTLKPEEILNKSHIEEVCKPGRGEGCCRYLIMNPEYDCARIHGDMGISNAIDIKASSGDMTAVAINCGGRYNSKTFGR